MSTFVMIGLNRAADMATAKAQHDFEIQEELLERNTTLTEEIHRLTSEIHQHLKVPKT